MCKKRSRQIKCIGTYIKSIVALYLEFYLFLVVAKLHITNSFSSKVSRLYNISLPELFLKNILKQKLKKAHLSTGQTFLCTVYSIELVGY